MGARDVPDDIDFGYVWGHQLCFLSKVFTTCECIGLDRVAPQEGREKRRRHWDPSEVRKNAVCHVLFSEPERLSTSHREYTMSKISVDSVTGTVGRVVFPVAGFWGRDNAWRKRIDATDVRWVCERGNT